MTDTTEDQLAKLEAEVSTLEAKLEKLDNPDPAPVKKIKRVQLAKQDECDCDPDDQECIDECEYEMGKSDKTDKPVKKAKAKADCDDDKGQDMTDTWSKEADDKKKEKDMAKTETKTVEATVEKKDDVKAEATVAAVEKKADETVTIEGQQISKSDPHYAIMKAQADRIEKAEQEIAKERDLREMAELRKSADDLYKHVPGTTDERAEMLKAVARMPEALQKQFTTVLTHSEKIAKAAFDTVGVNGGEIKKSAQAFEQKVSEIRKRDNCSRTEAMSKARVEDRESFDAFQGSN